jgi:type II secretory pathway component PulF
MENYQYKARDKFGKLVKGVMSAGSEAEISAKLKEIGYIPVVIEKKSEKEDLFKFFDKFRRIKFSEINMFTRQLHALLKAGITIVSALRALQEQTTIYAFKDVIGQIIRDIEAGSTLSSAMQNYPKVFNALYVSMIKSGEASGRLEEILERLAALGEHEEMIRLRIKSASRYPIIVVVALVTGFLVLTTLVVPRFANLYGQFTTELPLPTQILIKTNFVVRNYWWLLLIMLFIFIFFFRKFINTKNGRYLWDGFKLKVPVFGPLTLKLVMSRFTRVMGTLLHSGVPLLQILDLTHEGVGNVIVAQTVDNIKVSVNEGKGMLVPMKASGMFTPVVIQMVAVGEETGKLEDLLLHISNYYDAQIDYTVNNLLTLIEPILILVLGIAVLFMALGIFLPMWNLMDLFRR